MHTKVWLCQVRDLTALPFQFITNFHYLHLISISFLFCALEVLLFGARRNEYANVQNSVGLIYFKVLIPDM